MGVLVAFADGLGMGVLRSMTFLPIALDGLFSEDGKAKLKAVGEEFSVYSDVGVGVKYGTPSSAASRRNSKTRRSTHLS